MLRFAKGGWKKEGLWNRSNGVPGSHAGDEPIVRYEVWRDHRKVGQVTHKPQTNRMPFLFEDVLADKATHS